MYSVVGQRKALRYGAPPVRVAPTQPARESDSGSGAGGLPWPVWDALPADILDAFEARRLSLAQVAAHHADPARLRALIGAAGDGPDWAQVPESMQVDFLERRVSLAQIVAFLAQQRRAE